MKPAEGEGDHGAGAVGVDFRVGFVAVVVAVEILHGIELCGGLVETAQFSEGEGVVGEVGEVVVGLVEEVEGPGA